MDLNIMLSRIDVTSLTPKDLRSIAKLKTLIPQQEQKKKTLSGVAERAAKLEREVAAADEKIQVLIKELGLVEPTPE